MYQDNTMLKQLKYLRAVLTYRTPGESIKQTVDVVTFFIAGSNMFKSSQYGQTGFIRGACFANESHTYYSVNWSRYKQKRVCYSSHCAEILECTDLDDLG